MCFCLFIFRYNLLDRLQFLFFVCLFLMMFLLMFLVSFIIVVCLLLFQLFVRIVCTVCIVLLFFLTESPLSSMLVWKQLCIDCVLLA